MDGTRSKRQLLLWVTAMMCVGVDTQPTYAGATEATNKPARVDSITQATPSSSAADASAPGAATSTASPPKIITLKEVAVTGPRQAQRESIAAKQQSSLIQDSVSQDDIGRLPDTTVVEAARRIPGVSVNLLTDNSRGRTEVQRASIRGFDAKYNLVTIDDSKIASVDSAALPTGAVTRAFNLNLLPASLVSAIQVNKSITAQDDPQALGGQINLVTRSAFDSEKPLYVNFATFGGQDSTSGNSTSSKKPSGRASALISDRFSLGDDSRLGLTLAADYQNTFSASNGVTVGVPGATSASSAGWTYYGAKGVAVNQPSASPYGAIPTRFQVYSFDDQLKHYSVSGKVEFQVGTEFESSLFAGHYASDSIETRNENLLTRSSTSQIAGSATSSALPANLTSVSGLYPSNDGEVGMTYQPLHQSTDIFNWKNEYLFSNGLKLNVDAAYSEADGHLYRDMVKYLAASTVSKSSGSVSPANSPLLGFTYDTSQFIPRISLTNPASWSNTGAFTGDYWRSIHFDESNRVLDLHPNLSWNADVDSTGLGFRTGVRYTRSQIGYGENIVEYDPKVPAQFTLNNAQLLKNIPISSWGVPLSLIDRATADAILRANLPAFSSINEVTNDNANGFNFLEKTSAGYAEMFLNEGPSKTVIGLRYENTDNRIGSLQQVANGVYSPVTDTSSYKSLLPSIVESVELSPDIIGHAAFSKTLGRPDPSAYGPLAKVGQPANGQIAIALGNPSIKPRTSYNYDASMDFYFDHHDSLFSVQYFHKDLENEFYNKLSSAPYVYNGQTYVGAFTQPENGARASVNGVELNLQKDRLRFVPASWGTVGYGENFTRIHTSLSILDGNGNPRTLPNLVNQPSYIGNASMFYIYDDFQLALSYNIQGKTLFQTGAYSWEDTYVLARHQWDLTARYQITSNLTALFEGSNLTHEPFRSAIGANQQLIADDYNIGSQLWLGLNLQF